MRQTHVRALGRCFLTLVLASASLLPGCGKKAAAPTAPAVVLPVCALNTTTVSLGTVEIGESATAQFTLSNSGGGTLSGAVVDTSTAFAIVGDASYSLTAGQSKLFTVRFTPLAEGSRTATLTAGSSCAPIVCSGIGAVTPPQISVDFNILHFGSLEMGSSRYITISISNVGGGTFVGGVVGVGGDFTLLDPPHFSLTHGQYVVMGIQFQPSSTAAQVRELWVAPDVPGPTGQVSITCDGSGYFTPTGFCGASPFNGNVLDFGTVTIGDSAERTYTVKNQLPLGAYNTQGAVLVFCGDFKPSTDNTFVLSPQSTFSGKIRFSPTFEGVQYCDAPVSCANVGEGSNPGAQSYIRCVGVGTWFSTPRPGVSTVRLAPWKASRQPVYK